ncbi:unnamed protein product [Protopolystoma xenopodis]|uniref:PH domain-containing protein n=1 Tax=Protopolystoma xenopodis TaxID=117903 RepID=A0A448XGU3_9PLAT|nr:unnamed protein product [Protopolystoma xenopodis]
MNFDIPNHFETVLPVTKDPTLMLPRRSLAHSSIASRRLSAGLSGVSVTGLVGLGGISTLPTLEAAAISCGSTATGSVSAATVSPWTLAGTLFHRHKPAKWMRLGVCLLTRAARLIGHKGSPNQILAFFPVPAAATPPVQLDLKASADATTVSSLTNSLSGTNGSPNHSTSFPSSSASISIQTTPPTVHFMPTTHPSLVVFLVGAVGVYAGRDSGKEHVIKVTHPQQGTTVLAAESMEQAMTWIEQINLYARGFTPTQTVCFLELSSGNAAVSSGQAGYFRSNSHINSSASASGVFSSPSTAASPMFASSSLLAATTNNLSESIPVTSIHSAPPAGQSYQLVTPQTSPAGQAPNPNPGAGPTDVPSSASSSIISGQLNLNQQQLSNCLAGNSPTLESFSPHLASSVSCRDQHYQFISP